MGYKIDEVEGIGPAFQEKLTAAGIKTTDDLLKAGGAKPGRTELAAKTGISEGQLLKWLNRADLMRVSGVGKQFAELLECSGVDTVKELAQRNAENLAEAMTKVNAEKKLTKGAVNGDLVKGWVDQAKTMPAGITH